VIVFYRQRSNFSAISWQKHVTFLIDYDDDDDVRFVLDQHS
jgi:hypothetical protein